MCQEKSTADDTLMCPLNTHGVLAGHRHTMVCRADTSTNANTLTTLDTPRCVHGTHLVCYGMVCEHAFLCQRNTLMSVSAFSLEKELKKQLEKRQGYKKYDFEENEGMWKYGSKKVLEIT